jgi:hypothetical protein
LRIPTTEFCTACEAATPKDRLAKTGRDRVRVYQDLDTGEYSCEHGHKVIIESNEPGVVIEREIPGSLVVEKPLAHVRLENVTVPEQAQDTAVAVAEEPQKPFVLPGSARIREDHRLVVELSLPEQFAASLTEFCTSAGRTVEEYLSEFMDNACQNGWLF